MSLKKFLANKKNYPVLIPFISIVMAFLVVSVIMMMTGLSPLKALNSIFRGFTGIDLERLGTPAGFNSRIFGEFFVSTMPVMLTGLSVAFAFRTGLFNIGAEGQLMAGAYAAIAVGLLIEAPKIIHLPLAILAALVAGALWGAIPGLLKAKFKVNEVVVCIMLNYVALHLTNYGLKSLPGANANQTPPIHETASLSSDFLRSITSNSRLNWGFVIVILAVIAFYYIIEKTKFGYELRAVGFNKEAARYAGMKVDRNIVLSMMISGAFSGLAGAVVSLGTFGFGRILTEAEGYGFDGIAVSLIGGNSAIGTVFGGFIFGGLENASRILQLNRIPLEIAMIISALIVLFIAMRNGVEDLMLKLSRDHRLPLPVSEPIGTMPAPKALTEEEPIKASEEEGRSQGEGQTQEGGQAEEESRVQTEDKADSQDQEGGK